MVWIRMYANARAYIRKYVSKGALPWGGRVQPWGRRLANAGACRKLWELNVGEWSESVGEQPEAM